MEECIFSTVNACYITSHQPLSTSIQQRVDSILNASKVRDDGLHLVIHGKVNADSNTVLHYHKNSVSTYTSALHLGRIRSQIVDLPHRLMLQRDRRDLIYQSLNLRTLLILW